MPSPAQWVTVERIRLKDSYTHLWWMSPSERPKADNRRVLTAYSDAMKKLLETGNYNAGARPSEHHIGEKSFCKNNKGAISSNMLKIEETECDATESPANVVSLANTHASSDYLDYCRKNEIELHPARMPIALAEFFIKFLTEPGDLVVDPFGGSNTTGAAAEKLGRRWLTIEANPEYIKGSKGRFTGIRSDEGGRCKSTNQPTRSKH
ncbi:MAG: DNA methyltransferase [Limisphaerales bacterium]